LTGREAAGVTGRDVSRLLAGLLSRKRLPAGDGQRRVVLVQFQCMADTPCPFRGNDCRSRSEESIKYRCAASGGILYRAIFQPDARMRRQQEAHSHRRLKLGNDPFVPPSEREAKPT
jgi:hypothetical protein